MVLACTAETSVTGRDGLGSVLDATFGDKPLCDGLIFLSGALHSPDDLIIAVELKANVFVHSSASTGDAGFFRTDEGDGVL